MSDLNLHIATAARPEPALLYSRVPLATEDDFRRDNCFRPFASFPPADPDSLVYYNAATCPDCSGAMIRQGRCCVCPSCGFESCLV